MSLPNEVINALMSSAKDEDSYQISRSLRFNSADSAYLNRSYSTDPTNADIQTFSCWIKRTSFASTQILFHGLASSQRTVIRFTSSDQIEASINTGYNGNITFAVFRDPSSWYHIVVTIDSSQATAADRAKIYVNGTQQTYLSTTTNVPQNTDSSFSKNGGTNEIGRSSDLSQYFNGYMTQVHFIDGQALTPTSFAQSDANGRWVPKAYTGTYGTNGFYLNFSDNSGITSSTLGKDSSGNGNNWTPNNFSVTSGVGNDSLVDSPTNYGTDTGLGGEVRGNYATFNNVERPTLNAISDGSLRCVASSAAWYANPLTMSLDSGKWYCEFHITGGTYERHFIGIYYGSFYGYGYGDANEKMRRCVATTVPTSSTNLTPIPDFENGDIVGLCIDATNGKLWIKVNNSYIEGDAAAGTGANVTWSAGQTVTPVVYMYSGDSVYINTGQRPFAYTAPTGFKALCTQNLSTSSIKKPSQYMNTVTYTGTGATRSITGVGFQPDAVWTKCLGVAEVNRLVDSVRGTTKALDPGTTSSEATESGITSFDSDGFTINGTTDTGYNTNTYSYVALNWKKGTIPGFDIVTYTGNGIGGRTISHSLGIAPNFMLVKARSTTASPVVYPPIYGGTRFLQTDVTTGIQTASTMWNDTNPTSSVFTVGTNSSVNTSGQTYVNYLWTSISGFSKILYYLGNGSTDGPFVWCGFRPKFILIKSISTGNWLIYDSVRSPYNTSNRKVIVNGTSAEDVSGEDIDILSNGFKIRSTAADVNSSSVYYIFMAFAEAPFRYSRSR